MRHEAPVCFVPAVGLWFVTRWRDVEYAATHPELFNSRVTSSPLERTMGWEFHAPSHLHVRWDA